MTETFPVHIDGAIHLVPTECPHRKGRLNYGTIRRTASGAWLLTCPLHFSTFDLRTGCRVSGPACGDLAIIRIADVVSENAGLDSEEPFLDVRR